MIKKKRNCLVLDSSYLPRSITSTERAFVVVYKGNAEVIEHYDEVFHTVSKTVAYYKPSIIRINRFVNLEYREVPLTKNNIFKRDDYTCVYCGSQKEKLLTIDHVIPRSKGGNDKWDNVVTACNKCNNEKADLSVEEWGKPHPEPRRPHHLMILKKSKLKIPESWKQYLFI
jgi:5-methylcytosine-specific restriction endonuclease McrA